MGLGLNLYFILVEFILNGSQPEFILNLIEC